MKEYVLNGLALIGIIALAVLIWFQVDSRSSGLRYQVILNGKNSLIDSFSVIDADDLIEVKFSDGDLLIANLSLHYDEWLREYKFRRSLENSAPLLSLKDEEMVEISINFFTDGALVGNSGKIYRAYRREQESGHYWVLVINNEVYYTATGRPFGNSDLSVLIDDAARIFLHRQGWGVRKENRTAH